MTIPPVSTAPLAFRSLGIPPANKPPNCGAMAMADPVDASAVLALLLLNLFTAAEATAAAGLGMGGAAMVGGLARPEEDGPEGLFSTIGLLRSFVVAFLSLNAPELMSPRRAPLEKAH